MRALTERDDALAQDVHRRDRQVNAYDVEVERRASSCSPSTSRAGLRFITTIMRS